MSTLKVNTISEQTAGNGLAVDGLQIKDGGINNKDGASILVPGSAASKIHGFTMGPTPPIVAPVGESQWGNDIGYILAPGAAGIAYANKFYAVVKGGDATPSSAIGLAVRVRPDEAVGNYTILTGAEIQIQSGGAQPEAARTATSVYGLNIIVNNVPNWDYGTAYGVYVKPVQSTGTWATWVGFRASAPIGTIATKYSFQGETGAGCARVEDGFNCNGLGTLKAASVSGGMGIVKTPSWDVNVAAQQGFFRPGGLCPTYVATAVDYTTKIYSHTIAVDTTGGDRTVTLLPADGTVDSQILVIKKMAAGNSLIVDGDSAETIEGAATLTLTALNEAYTIQSDGTAWHILSHYVP